MRLLIFLVLLLQSCTYRFNNLSLKPPKGLRTIAIEAIFDTGRTPLPHEILWVSLQKQFAIDGRLQVTSPEQADVYLRAHIFNSTLYQNGQQSFYQGMDPKELVDKESGQVQSPFAFQNLNRAKDFANYATVSVNVEVQFWDLYTKTLLHQKTYQLSKRYEIFDAAIPLGNQFIQAQETLEINMEEMSDSLARSIVYDFLSLRGKGMPAPETDLGVISEANF